MIIFKHAFSRCFSPLAYYFGLAAMGLSLQACVVVQPKTAQNAPDNSIITGSITAKTASLPKVDLGGDEQAMGKKIAAEPNSSTLNWQNEATGSRGTMSILNNFVENGNQCRTFKTTRESFNGIMMYQGKACQQEDATWNMTQIKAL